jgi:uroporphyrinogen decarboxylase
MAQPRPLASIPDNLLKENLKEYERSAFVRACLRQETPFTPVWLMRQAGRYMPKYREIRSKVGFLELCKTPELAAEVTVMAVEDLGVDAAIIFADILLILEPLGVGLEFAKGEGPVIHRPVRDSNDVELLTRFKIVDELNYVLEAIRLTRSSLPSDIPLIGFAGAPFTLASYLIEGGSSRNFDKTKTFMYRNANVWHELMALLTDLTIEYLRAQAKAGASVLQIFDSWVGSLSQQDYVDFVLPHMVRTIDSISDLSPIIHFGTSTTHLLRYMADCGGHVMGLDWRVDLDQGWAMVGRDRFAVQGNLDPVVLFAERSEIKKRVQRILLQAEGTPGHIFNLGHGILPTTPLDNVKYLVDVVHELSHK